MVTGQVAIGAAVGVCILLWRVGQGAAVLAPEDLQQLLDQDVVLAMALSALPVTLLTLVVCVGARRYIDHRTWRSMGFARPAVSGRDGIWCGFLLGLGTMLAAACVITVLGGYRWHSTEVSAMNLVMIPVLFALAFSEEVLFRGYLLQNLLDEGRTGFGIGFTAVVFWLVHGLNPGAWESPFSSLNLLGAGILLAQAYVISGNIWYPTMLHFGWNAAQGLLLSIPVSGLRLDGVIRLSQANDAPQWLTGGSFGLEGSAVVTLLELMLIGVFAVWMRRDARGTMLSAASKSTE